MSNLGGTHTHTILEYFISQNNTLKTALNNNLKRFAPDYLRNHLYNKAEYLLFKDVRKTLTFWYTKCQNLYKQLLTRGQNVGHPTTSLHNSTQQALDCIEFTETLLNTTNNSFLIAKAYRTVVLTYKYLSDGHIKRETQAYRVVHSTPNTTKNNGFWGSNTELRIRTDISHVATDNIYKNQSTSTDLGLSRAVETQTAMDLQNTTQYSTTEVQTDIVYTKEVETNTHNKVTLTQDVGTDTYKQVVTDTVTQTYILQEDRATGSKLIHDSLTGNGPNLKAFVDISDSHTMKYKANRMISYVKNGKLYQTYTYPGHF